MKRTILLILLLATPVWSATYYVSGSGSNTSPYETWAKAALLPSTAVTAGNTDVGGDGPHTMYIAPGTYSDAMTFADADWANGTLIGTSAHGSTSPAAKGQVIISGGGSSSVYNVNVTDLTVQNLSLTSTTYPLRCAAANFTGQNLYCYDSGGSLAYMASATNFWLDRCWFRGSTTSYCVYPASACSGTISNSIIGFSDSNPAATSTALYCSATGTVNVYNCTIGGGSSLTVKMSGAGTLNITNCVLRPSPVEGAIVSRTNGTLNLVTNHILVNWGAAHLATSGTINTDTDNIYDSAPALTRRSRTGIIVPCVDDTGNLAYAQALETKLAAHGMGGTYYISGAGVAANAAALQTMFDNGTISIGGHGWTHSELTATGTYFSVTKAGATIDVDRATDTITIAPGGTVSPFKSLNVTNLKQALVTLGCTCGVLNGSVNNNSLGEAIADSEGAQASPYELQILIDTTGDSGLFKTEVKDVLAVLEANISGYTAKAYATPYGSSSVDLETAVKTVGFLGCRNFYATGHIDLTSTNVYQHRFMVAEDIIDIDANDAHVARNAAALAEMVSEWGCIAYLLAHDATELTLGQWEIVLDEFAKYDDVLVLSHDDALDLIRDAEGDWSTEDDITYTRTWTDQSDYHLLSTSPCIDAGTNLGATYDEDYDGKDQDLYGSGWEIGAYAYPIAKGYTGRSGGKQELSGGKQ